MSSFLLVLPILLQLPPTNFHRVTSVEFSALSHLIDHATPVFRTFHQLSISIWRKPKSSQLLTSHLCLLTLTAATSLKTSTTLSPVLPASVISSLQAIPYLCACILSHFSHVPLFPTLCTVAHQAPLFMGILQARILERVAMPFSRGSSRPSDWTRISHISCIGSSFSTTRVT